jgi:hypothetical protein
MEIEVKVPENLIQSNEDEKIFTEIVNNAIIDSINKFFEDDFSKQEGLCGEPK